MLCVCIYRVAGTSKKEIIIQASLDLKMAAVNLLKHFAYNFTQTVRWLDSLYHS